MQPPDCADEGRRDDHMVQRFREGNSFSDDGSNWLTGLILDVVVATRTTSAAVQSQQKLSTGSCELF